MLPSQPLSTVCHSRPVFAFLFVFFFRLYNDVLNWWNDEKTNHFVGRCHALPYERSCCSWHTGKPFFPHLLIWKMKRKKRRRKRTKKRPINRMIVVNRICTPELTIRVAWHRRCGGGNWNVVDVSFNLNSSGIRIARFDLFGRPINCELVLCFRAGELAESTAWKLN